MRCSTGAVVSRLAAVAGLCAAVAAPAAAQSVTYIGSVQASTGDYIFTDRTTSLYFVNGIELTAGLVRVSGTLPVIGQSTPWVTYGPVAVPSGGKLSGEVAREVMGRGTGQGRRTITLPVTQEGVAYATGVGDPLVRADVEFVTDRGSRPSLRINASAKFPLADPDNGFGTGAWDYGGGVSLSKRIRRRSMFVDVAYWNFGDLPDLQLKDAVAYSVGYGQILGTGRWSMLASVSGWTAIIDGASPQLELGLGLSRLIKPGRSISISAGVGLTETAPDVSIGLGWRVAL